MSLPSLISPLYTKRKNCFTTSNEIRSVYHPRRVSHDELSSLIQCEKIFARRLSFWYSLLD